MEVAQSVAQSIAQSAVVAGVTPQINYKNLLQDHTQRSAIPLPTYQTLNEGPQHPQRFRSTVFVDGSSFVSSRTCLNRKEAEQDVARVALEGISLKIKHEGVPLINNDTTFCKSILHEYATKLKIKMPVYTTAASRGLLPLFITSVDFNGKTYKGGEGRSKKEAEQLAARATIESILGSSDSGTVLAQIIKSKNRLYAALHKGSNSCLNLEDEVPLGGLLKNHPSNSVVGVVHSALTNSKLSAAAHSVAFSPVQPAFAHAVTPPPVQPAIACALAPPPVQLAIACAPASPPVQPASLVNSVPNEAKMHKKEHACEVSGSVESETSRQANDQPAGSTSMAASFHDKSHVEQCAQVKNEFPLDGPPVVPEKPKSDTGNSGQKRSRKNKRDHYKRTRTGEQPLATAALGESSVNAYGV